MHRILVLIFITTSTFVFSQEISKDYYAAPVNIPMFLTGNFGELRSNHFHSGIDIRTEGRTRLPVFAVADGYVSRISVSPYGFGHALYVNHPNGTTTVYGHLEAFSEKIQKYVRGIQYDKESFSFDVSVPSGTFPVKKGEQIALSGNSGSSGGPHLHFEIRNTDSEKTMNPLKFKFAIKDAISPKVLSVLLYPVSDDATVAGKQLKQRHETVFYNGAYRIPKDPVISVSGTVGFGIEAIDYLDGNWSKCGIYSLVLKVDDKPIYSFKMDEFSFDETRYINSHTDYDQKIRFARSSYKTWIEPGNKLSIYDRETGNGLYTFSDDKTHRITYEITDTYGNPSKMVFSVISKRTMVQRPEEKGILFEYDEKNEFEEEGIELEFPKGTFYSDFHFQYEKRPSFPGIYSDIHGIHNKYTPVHQYFSATIETKNLPERLEDKALLVYVDPQTNKISSAIGGEFDDGWVEAKMRGFGYVAVTVDTVPPSVVPLSLKNGSLTESSQIRFKISDNLSGVDSFRGTIDEQWVLFEYDAKNNLLVYKFDKERFAFGKQHQLKLSVSDTKGNTKIFEAKFYK
ncbi:MAG: hypothetical protein A2W90_16955 [Bacteroidetes bacterium GWF2_42_66]|nr:MAG: hypothetical protein A2W92_03660 [Bacteroidetes bacterium GWA2_42_15]OFX96378.1 MAG: hypothetical protein A2W89_05885 [Bacteroidetes bacterium GWE2_42_39]OFY46417.1 MAG: hypothetical protein A2W90_16955 [Bacteroidetes bacterium GWF2_42_66]HBL78196.1 M23 family peptidase [Prolixibacteraceae bacterium]HCR89362.1 M23 family peptidase [Prolixibacteraceae bacterium]